MNILSQSPNSAQVPNLDAVQIDEYSLKFCILWAAFEQDELRRLKHKIQREKNPKARYELQINLTVRVNRYIHIVTWASQKIMQSGLFATLPLEGREIILSWAQLADGGR